jgi:hypothetical protein
VRKKVNLKMSLLLTVFLGLEEEKGEKVQPRLFTVVF